MSDILKTQLLRCIDMILDKINDINTTEEELIYLEEKLSQLQEAIKNFESE